MRQLKIIRTFIAVLFFAASVAYLFIGPHVHPMAVVSKKVQIIPSAIAVTIGATLVWLLITFLLGRVYCSTVCPVGTLQDVVINLKRRIPRLKKPFSYKTPKRWRLIPFFIYLVFLVGGLFFIPYLLEPWNIMRNMASTVRPDAIQNSWMTLGVGAGVGILAGCVSFVGIVLAAFFTGRDFCNTVCPIGNAMIFIGDQTLYRIEIDPDKCVGCLKCEDVCKSSCIKVTERFVDNSRCVRCFDCLAECPNDAIRYQSDRNRRPATPLMQRNH